MQNKKANDNEPSAEFDKQFSKAVKALEKNKKYNYREMKKTNGEVEKKAELLASKLETQGKNITTP